MKRLVPIASFAAFALSLSQPVSASARDAAPAWLALRAGTEARVDVAPWYDSDEPEAALTASPGSLARDFTADGTRPGDVVFQPIGTRVRVIRVLAGGRIAYVRGRDARFVAYALVARLVPEIPPGTALRVAGGFEGFADFFSSVATPYRTAERIATGTRVVALGLGAGPFDRDASDLVRVRVRVKAGATAGSVGWIPVAYVGIPRDRIPATARPIERSCTCRLVEFRSASESPI